MDLLDFVFPKFCLGCGKFGLYVCATCTKGLPHLPYLKCPACYRPSYGGRTHPRCKTKYGLDGVTSFFPYTGTIQKLIKAIKYRFAYAIVEEITPMMRVPDFPSNSVLVPIPLHTLRHRWRGFNQAERIARALSKQTGTPVLKNVLVRTKNTIAQAETKSFAERQGNMKNSFQVQRTPDQTKTIFLIDDVFTTGATLQAACVALKRAGAKNVWGLTIAQ